MRKALIALLIVFVFTTLVACSSEKTTTKSSETTATITSNEETSTSTIDDTQGYIRLKNTHNGAKYNLLGDIVNGYLEATNKAQYLEETQNYNSQKSLGVNISFETNLNISKFTLMVSENESFEDATTKTVLQKSDLLFNLKKGKYYYKVVASKFNIESDVDSFEITNSIRTINTTGVTNMRDLGGYKTVDGKATKYGMVYRSAEPSVNDTILFRDELGIKVEIDLRNDDKLGDYQGVYPGIDYIRVPKGSASVWPQYDLIFTPGYKDTISNLYKEAYSRLSNPESYPINFHCSAGADRAGTFSCLLLALLGVEYDDLATDYELTTYYRAKRFRSSILHGDNGYYFSERGVYDVPNEHFAFDLFINELLKRYGSDGTLKTASYTFLNEYLGIDTQTLDKVIELMTE